MRISDWSSDVCSSDLDTEAGAPASVATVLAAGVSPPLAIDAAVSTVAADVADAVTLVSSLAITTTTTRRLRLRPSARSLSSEEGRVGKELVRAGRYRGASDH